MRRRQNKTKRLRKRRRRRKTVKLPYYNAKKWNKNPYLRKSHNCYSYFLNKIRKSFTKECRKRRGKKCPLAKPGYYAGYPKIIFKNLRYTCDSLERGLLDDNTSIFSTTFKKGCPRNYYMGALVTDPGRTFHFYRQDSDGTWSHKDGPLPISRRDAAGKRIKNPKRANRRYTKKRRYSDFCNFYCVPAAAHKKHIKLLPRRRP